MSATGAEAAERVRRHSGAMARFGVVGIGNTLTEFLIFGALLHVGVSAIGANAVGFFCANIQSYFVNAHVTFRKDGAAAVMTPAGYGRFFLAHCLSLAISTLFIVLFADDIGPLLAKVAAAGFGFLANYSMSAIFVFRRKGDEARAEPPPA